MITVVKLLIPYLFLIIIQFVLPKYFNFNNIYPNFIMMYVVFIALNKGSMNGQISGFIYGFTWDVLSTDIFGLRALTLTICGHLAGKFNKKLNIDRALVQIMLMFVCLVITQISFILLYLIIPNDFGNRTLFANYNILISVLLTLILTPFVFKVLNYFYNE